MSALSSLAVFMVLVIPSAMFEELLSAMFTLLSTAMFATLSAIMAEGF